MLAIPQGPRPRKQLVVKVPPATRETWTRITNHGARSITFYIESAAEGMEERTLKRLTKEQHGPYLAGRLRVWEAFPNAITKGKMKTRTELVEARKRLVGPGVPTATLSALITEKAKRQLDRFLSFYALSLGDFFTRHGRTIERAILSKLTPDQQKIYMRDSADRDAEIAALMLVALSDPDQEDTEQ